MVTNYFDSRLRLGLNLLVDFSVLKLIRPKQEDFLSQNLLCSAVELPDLAC